MPVDSIDAFVEALIISMSGCGVGYSVERSTWSNCPASSARTGRRPSNSRCPTRPTVGPKRCVWRETWLGGGDWSLISRRCGRRR
ncbi:MAG: hypothetical protein R2838_08075 [Caldilineaceae bacterium]